MIYQLVNETTEILPLATSYIAHLCNKSDFAFAVLIFKFSHNARFQKRSFLS